MFMPETIVTRQGNDVQLRKVLLRTSQIMDFKDDRGNPDDASTELALESEKEIIAELIFRKTEDILFTADELDNAYEWDKRRTFNTHIDKVSWSERNLMRLEIRDPWNKMILSRIEKDGVTMGIKRKSDEDEETDKQKGQKMLEEAGVEDGGY
tara:strand:+ start:221 stop:679 length:459 start_codon:yes stop_codon:yes gene_type:complete